MAVYVALSLPVLAGLAGLAVDVTDMYLERRDAQSVADAVAYAAALDRARQGLEDAPDLTALNAVGQDAADRNDYAGDITINSPPLSGPLTGDTRAVEAVVQRPKSLSFGKLLADVPPQVGARATAIVTVSDACLWSLNPSQKAAFKVSGTAEVALGCGVVVNSDHPEAALDQGGSSCLSGTSVAVVGNYSGSCVTPEPEVFTAPYGDPLAGLAPPAYGTCDHTKTVKVTGGVETLWPGVYCEGISISGGTVTFKPGLYVLKEDLSISGGATIDNGKNGCGGVTFYLTGTGSKFAQVDVAGGTDVTLEPMTCGPYANILFFQDAAASSTGSITNKFNGGASMNLTGIIYIPNQAVEFSGGSVGNELDLAIVADTIAFSGNTYLSATGASTFLPGRSFVRLAE